MKTKNYFESKMNTCIQKKSKHTQQLRKHTQIIPEEVMKTRLQYSNTKVSLLGLDTHSIHPAMLLKKKNQAGIPVLKDSVTCNNLLYIYT